MTTVAVLGLGEAGGEIARDLVTAGCEVRAYDPALETPSSMCACRDEEDAARGADLVLSVNSAEAAEDALARGVSGCGSEAIWADLNTASPALEARLADVAADAGVSFADVSLMAPVPGKGLRTPMLVSGDGAPGYRSALTAVGADVEVVDGPAGEAARRKLLRSVFFKGMAAAVVEAVQAASALGLDDWMRDLVATELAAADRAFAERLETGSIRHAVRRTEEMAAAVEMLGEVGVPARIAGASRDWLAELSERDGAQPVASSRTSGRTP